MKKFNLNEYHKKYAEQPLEKLQYCKLKTKTTQQ